MASQHFNNVLSKGKIIMSGMVLLWACVLLTPSKAAAFQDDPSVDFNQYQGEVVDESTNRPLVFATLSVEGTNISTITNTEGNFLLKVPKDITNANVIVSFLGYKSKTLPLSTLDPEKNKISLLISITELSEININAP